MVMVMVVHAEMSNFHTNKYKKMYFAKISLGFGSHLFYKTEYMGRSCLNQVYAINFNLSAPAT